MRFAGSKRAGIFGFLVVVLVLGTVGSRFFSQREICFRNGAIQEKSWRYNSSISQVADDYLVSTFDKLTRTTTIETFSISQEKVIRTVLINEKTGEIRVLGEDGELLHEETVTSFEHKLKNSRKEGNEGS